MRFCLDDRDRIKHGVFASSSSVHPFLWGTKVAQGKTVENLNKDLYSIDQHTQNVVLDQDQAHNRAHLQHSLYYPRDDPNAPYTQNEYSTSDNYVAPTISPYVHSYATATNERKLGYDDHDYIEIRPVHGPAVSIPTEPQMGLIDIAKQQPIEQSPTLEVNINKVHTHPPAPAVSSVFPHHGETSESALEEIRNEHVHHVQNIIHNEVIDTANGPIVIPHTETHIWLSSNEPPNEESNYYVGSPVEHVGGHHESSEMHAEYPKELQSGVHGGHQVTGHTQESHLEQLGPLHNHEPYTETHGGEHLFTPHSGHLQLPDHGFNSGEKHFPRPIEHLIVHSPNEPDMHHITPVDESIGHLSSGYEINNPNIGLDIEDRYKSKMTYPHIGVSTGHSIGYPNADHHSPTLESKHMSLHVPGPFSVHQEGTHFTTASEPQITDLNSHGVTEPVNVGINLPQIHIWPNAESYPGAHMDVPNSDLPDHVSVDPPGPLQDNVYSGGAELAHMHSHVYSSRASSNSVGIKAPQKGLEQEVAPRHDHVGEIQQNGKGT